MQTLQRAMLVVLEAIYGLIASIFAYSPGSGNYSVPQVMQQLLQNPCNVQQGVIGVIFSDPGVLSVVMSIVAIIGALIFVAYIVLWFILLVARVIGTATIIFGSFVGRIGRAAGMIGGRSGETKDGAQGYEQADIGHQYSFGTAAKGFAIFVIAMLLASNVNSSQLQSVVQTAGTVISWTIMAPTTIALGMMANLMGVVTGGGATFCATASRAEIIGPNGLATLIWLLLS